MSASSNVSRIKWRDKAQHGLLVEFDSGIYHVREYPNRIAVSRIDGFPLSWEELQAAKSLVWGGGHIAIEVYPADSKVVNLRNTRHLWTTPEIEALVRSECRHPEFDK